MKKKEYNELKILNDKLNEEIEELNEAIKELNKELYGYSNELDKLYNPNSQKINEEKKGLEQKLIVLENEKKELEQKIMLKMNFFML